MVLIGLGTLQKMLGHVGGAELFARQVGTQFNQGLLMQGFVAHSITLGTKNKPRSTAGALRWLASR